MLTALFISGCGSDKKETSTKVVSASKGNQAEGKTKENAGKVADTNNANDFSTLISYMEKETEGTAKILYENKQPQVHNMDGITVTLDAYTLLELNDFHSDFSIPFNDQTNGGVIIAKFTVKNELDKNVYYMPALSMSFTGAQKDYNNDPVLLPRKEQITEKLTPSNDYLLKAGESVTGYYAYPFGKDDLQKVLDLSTTMVEVPEAQAVKGSFGSPIGTKGKFSLSLSKDGAEKVQSNAVFYKDKVTTEDMGEKKMLKEKSGIGKSEQLGNVTVTLDGYQFAEFIPNEVEAPRFADYKNGIVLLTVKFNLDNKGTDSISLTSTSSKLTVNDGAQYMLKEGMLLNYKYSDLIASGKSGEMLQIYVLDKEQYDKIWNNKPFEVEIGPILNQEAKDISKGKKAAFDF
jgi:uncharacterized protein YjbJ (UPF0337 family)